MGSMLQVAPAQGGFEVWEGRGTAKTRFGRDGRLAPDQFFSSAQNGTPTLSLSIQRTKNFDKRRPTRVRRVTSPARRRPGSRLIPGRSLMGRRHAERGQAE